MNAEDVAALRLEEDLEDLLARAAALRVVVRFEAGTSPDGDPCVHLVVERDGMQPWRLGWDRVRSASSYETTKGAFRATLREWLDKREGRAPQVRAFRKADR